MSDSPRGGSPGGASVTLVAPGLLEPAAGEDAPIPECPSLAALLAAADRAFAPPLLRRLCAQFGVDPGPDRDPPAAALEQLAVNGERSGETLAYLAPVHLQVDRDRAYVTQVPDATLDPDTEQRLLDSLDGHLAADGARLQRLDRCRWLLRWPGELALRTRPLGDVLGEDAFGSRVVGAGARRWEQVATEMQMLLHRHPVNEQRESQGLASINSVWLWGCGALPHGAHSPYAVIHAEDAVTRGLAVLAGARLEPVPRCFADLAPGGTRLVHLGRVHPGAAWHEWLQALESDWFAPLAAALATRTVAEVELWPGDALACTVPASRFRWWRRPRGRRLRDHLEGAGR